MGQKAIHKNRQIDRYVETLEYSSDGDSSDEEEEQVIRQIDRYVETFEYSSDDDSSDEEDEQVDRQIRIVSKLDRQIGICPTQIFIVEQIDHLIYKLFVPTTLYKIVLMMILLTRIYITYII